ncbi:hypothetical protein N431DRAFT_349711 [Stipitochalara longipes BDJ]|nr:hypothetical protein N431DRAFT_349711 [Stipitochalara longipes BDJ]
MSSPTPILSAAVDSNLPHSQPSQPSPEPTTPSGPLEALKCSLLSGKFSDLTIAHGTRRWKAHKVVVCTQSAVLEAKIEALAALDSLLHLDDYDHESVCSMIDYLYSTEYTTTDHEPDFSLPHHIKVFRLAVQLSISGLEELAARKFAFTLLHHIKDLDVYFTSVKDIYTSNTPEHPTLRLIVVEAAATELRNLVNEPRFLDLTSSVKDFQVDIYLFLVNHPSRTIQVEPEYIFPELCDECGPRNDNDGYEVETECKGCGKLKTLAFY